MKIKDFGVEMYMNTYENDCKYNLAETCVSPLTVGELLLLAGGDADGREYLVMFNELSSLKLTYGYIEGNPKLRKEIAGLYKKLAMENILMTHGGIGANELVIKTLVEPGDTVISVLPTYQQHYSIPESLGAKVKILPLLMENQFLPVLGQLSELMDGSVKLLNLNNPNNPSGAVMDGDFLERIVEIVKPYGTYILCDEAYRGLNHQGENLSPSISDVYEFGISTSSLSKTFSLAGLRLGWIAAPTEVIEKIMVHRDYNTISCGVLDEYLAAIAMENKEKIWERNLLIVRRNAKTVDDWVQANPLFSYVKPKAGTTAFIRYGIDLPSAEFCKKLLAETGVLVVPGQAMGVEGFFRLGYAFDPEVLAVGLKHIADFAKKVAGS